MMFPPRLRLCPEPVTKGTNVGPAKAVTATSWLRKPVSLTPRGRVPPSQALTPKFPVLHVGDPPALDPRRWTPKAVAEAENPLALTWEQVLTLPSITSISDFHCVASWSRLDNRWEGVAFRTLAEQVHPKAHARYVIGEDDWGYTANFPLEALMDDEVLPTYKHDARELEAVHGGPYVWSCPNVTPGSLSNGCGPYAPASTTNRGSGKSAATAIPPTPGRMTVTAFNGKATRCQP